MLRNSLSLVGIATFLSACWATGTSNPIEDATLERETYSIDDFNSELPSPVGDLPPSNTGVSKYSTSIYAGPNDASSWLSENAVLHFDDILDKGAIRKGFVDVFLDAYGTLYPETGYGTFSADEAYEGLARYGGDLAWAFGENGSVLCQKAAGGDVKKMCDATPSSSELVQDEMWLNKARQILDGFSPTDGRPNDIVVFLHGFNVTDPRSDYDKMIKRIQKSDLGDRERVYVGIYWDGGGYNSGVRHITKWTRAQYTGPVVGFEMRRLFNAIQEVSEERSIDQPSIRLVSHSSGAFVSGAIFGNPYSALPALREGEDIYAQFKANRLASTGRWRIPQITDLSLGYIAPATGSWTFTGYVRQKPDSADNSRFVEAKDSEGDGWFDFDRGIQVQKTRLAFSQKASDVAVGRHGFHLGFLGSVHLGSKKSSGCEIVQWSKKRGLGTDVVTLNFKPTLSDRLRKLVSPSSSHSLENYMQQKASEDFIDFLLDQPVSGDFIHDCP